MAVTAATAQKAVDRWQLDRVDSPRVSACGCRWWSDPSMVLGWRQVYACGRHR